MDQTRPQEPTLSEVGAHVKEDLAQLREAAERRREEIFGQLRSYVDQHPLASVGVAFGVGYLLSGALLSRMTWRVLTHGARWYAGRLARELLSAEGLQAGGFAMSGYPPGGGRA